MLPHLTVSIVDLLQKPLTIDVRAAINVATRFRGCPDKIPRSRGCCEVAALEFREKPTRFEETPRSRRYSIFHRLGVTSWSQRSGQSPQFADVAFGSVLLLK